MVCEREDGDKKSNQLTKERHHIEWRTLLRTTCANCVIDKSRFVKANTPIAGSGVSIHKAVGRFPTAKK